MLKNKFKTLITLTIIFAIFFCPFVKADNEENTEPINEEEYAEESTTNVSQPSEENVKKEDFYLFEDEVTIDYEVDGNVFVCANTVNIKSKIGGDLFVCADTVNIENGYVYSNVFCCAKKLNINGVIYDLYAACSEINIQEDGYVYRDLHAGADNINIYGTVGRNAYIEANNISLSKSENEDSSENSVSATIFGDLNYTSNNEIEIPDDAVEGETNFSKEIKQTSSLDTVLSVISSIIFTILVYLSIIFLAPKFKNSLKENLSGKISSVIGLGALALIITPIIAFLLLLTGLVSTFGLLLTAIYGILIAISSSIFIIALSDFISNKINTDNKFAKFGILAGIALIISLLKLIPYVSGIVTLICVWLGTGLIMKKLLPNKNAENA